jgi:hypothetical protein
MARIIRLTILLKCKPSNQVIKLKTVLTRINKVILLRQTINLNQVALPIQIRMIANLSRLTQVMAAGTKLLETITKLTKVVVI